MRGLKSCFLTKNTFAHLIHSHYGCWFTDPKVKEFFEPPVGNMSIDTVSSFPPLVMVNVFSPRWTTRNGKS